MATWRSVRPHDGRAGTAPGSDAGYRGRGDSGVWNCGPDVGRVTLGRRPEIAASIAGWISACTMHLLRHRAGCMGTKAVGDARAYPPYPIFADWMGLIGLQR